MMMFRIISIVCAAQTHTHIISHVIPIACFHIAGKYSLSGIIITTMVIDLSARIRVST